MNILILGVYDHSGAGHALYEAVNEHTPHDARQVAFETSYLDYPVDIKRPNNEALADLFEWADVVNLHDATDYIIPLDAPLRPTVVTYHGSDYRARWPYYNHFDRRFGRIPTALCLDLVMYGPRWLPRAVPDHSHLLERTNKVFKVAHAPTNRQIKSTEQVIEALEGMEGVELDLIEGVSNAECVARKARADLLVEEFIYGYGTGALEGWALGIPVLCDAAPAILFYIQEKLDVLPFHRTPVDRIKETVELMRDDQAVYDSAAQSGRDYWEEYHHPKVVADKFVGFCEEVINGRSNE